VIRLKKRSSNLRSADPNHSMSNGISIIIPTCNGGRIFSECLAVIKRQEYAGPVQLIVVDSGSIDKTVELAMKAGAQVKRIDPKQFHHARTRNEALPLAEHEKVVFMVQDVIPLSELWLASLSQTLDDYPVAAAYTAQIPHDDATPYARFEIESVNAARGNLPVIQQIESLESFQKMPYHKAYRAVGLDNVCAIYRTEFLMKVPFPEVDFAEDLAWAHKSLCMEYKILYAPNIKVKHSHNRSPEYAFRRQITNSLWCAKILKRVEADLSFLNLINLRTLTRRVLVFVSEFRRNIGLNTSKCHISDLLLMRILREYPLGQRLKGFFSDRAFSSNGKPPERLEVMLSQIQTTITTHFHLIKKKYELTNQEEKVSMLDQIIANSMGRLYGEVYASRSLKGNLSPSFQSMMHPFICGV